MRPVPCRPRLPALVILAGAAACGPSACGPAPDASAGVAATPTLFDRLAGSWEGEGTLLGRPGRFHMRWTRLADGRWARLEFRNGFVGPDGATTPILEAVAFYPIRGAPGEDATAGDAEPRVGPAPHGGTSGPPADGWWFDSRGERLLLGISVEEDLLRVDWTASSEQGRTVYRPGNGRVEVADSVWRDGALAEFARATYVAAPDAGVVEESLWIPTEDGLRMRARAVGTGPETWVVPMDVFLKDALGPLARGRRLVFYDPLGRGASDAIPLERLSEDRQLRDLEALRRHLGLERMGLIGWSGPGKLVARYAIEHPERVSGLLLISPVGPASSAYPLEDGIPSRDDKLDGAAYEQLQAERAAGAFAGDTAAACRAENGLLYAASLADGALSALVPDVCVHPNEWPERLYPWFGALLDSFGTFDHGPAFRASPVRTLVIHGREDGIPLAGGRAWVAGARDARLLVLTPAGHFPFLEMPLDFTQAARTFLDGGWPDAAEAVPGS
ncbi:MAG: alpha/beta hydrolase [Gemmatimonadota bacterium]